MANEKLRAAISAYHIGNIDEARQILFQVVHDEPENDTAWLWLSACVESATQKKHYLSRALAINPKNDLARTAMSRLDEPGARSPISVTPAAPDGSQADMVAPSLLTANRPPQTTPAPWNGPSMMLGQPASSDSNIAATLTVILLVLLGLFWLAIGILQISLNGVVNSSATQIGLVCTGIWNIGVSIINLLVIRDVMRRHKVAFKYLVLLAILGAVWGLLSLALGSWLNVCVVPFYILLGILVYVNKDYFTVLTPRELKKLEQQKAE